MNAQAARERALDACLAAGRGGTTVDADAARPAGADADAEVAELLSLAQALDALPKPPGPDPAFRAQLAARLAVAPSPAARAPEAVALPTVTLVNDLDACLEAVLAGQIAPEEALARFPEAAAELAPLLGVAATLADLPGVPAPAVAFRRRLAAELAVAPEPSSLLRRRAAGGGLLARLRRSTAVAAALAASVVVFLVAGAGYASPNALPGQPLYPVKRGLEQARLWVVSGEAEVVVHLDYAANRLAEALTVPVHAHAGLADFSREVTAALAGADAVLADGAPRGRVVPPLLARLRLARGDLVHGGPRLPPTAWRSALALVDTAIALLNGGDVAARAIPRLFGPAVPAPVRPVVVVAPPAVLGPVIPATPAQVGLVPGGAGRPGAAVGPGRAGAVGSPPISAGAAPTSAAGAAPPVGGTSGGEPGQTATARPTRPPASTEPATPTPAVPSAPPPSDTPRPPDTATPAPTAPATGVPSEPAPPTVVPSPTNTPDKLPPVITAVKQTVLSVPLGGVADFEVDAYDPDGGPLTYAWSASWGEMLPPTDRREATFHAIGNMSGMGLLVTVTIRVTDQTGTWAEKEVYIEVVPRVEGPRRQ